MVMAISWGFHLGIIPRYSADIPWLPPWGCVDFDGIEDVIGYEEEEEALNETLDQIEETNDIVPQLRA